MERWEKIIHITVWKDIFISIPETRIKYYTINGYELNISGSDPRQQILNKCFKGPGHVSAKFNVKSKQPQALKWKREVRSKLRGVSNVWIQPTLSWTPVPSRVACSLLSSCSSSRLLRVLTEALHHLYSVSGQTRRLVAKSVFGSSKVCVSFFFTPPKTIKHLHGYNTVKKFNEPTTISSFLKSHFSQRLFKWFEGYMCT